MKINSLRLIYRINVRFVAAISLLCALVAAGWVAWRLSSWQPRIPVNPSTALATPLPTGEWRQSADQETAWSEADPFTSPYLEARLAKKAAARAAEKARKTEEAKALAAEKARKAEEAKALAAAKAQQEQINAKIPSPATTQHQPKPGPKPTAPLPSPVPPRTITLIYRGMLTHIDGSSVAIVEQVENGKTTMMMPGDTLEGFSMAQLDRAAAILTTDDGKTEHALPVGEQIKLMPGKQKSDTQ